MERNFKGLLIRLALITGVLSACPLLAVIMEAYAGSKSPDSDRAVYLLIFLLYAPYLLFFILALVVLPYTAWRGVTVYGMEKMEAFWWVSVPHTVIFGLYVRLFRLSRFPAQLVPFFLVLWITIVATGVWTLVTVYRVAISKADLTTKKKAMLAFALLLPVLLWA